MRFLQCGTAALPFALLVLGASSRGAWAQDTTWKEGVRITGIYAPGSKPGLLVLPITGTHGDSLRAMFQRDFQHGNRISVIALDASSVPPANTNGTLNYPLYARLGANALLQVQPTSYGIRVVVHNVGRAQMERARDFPLPAQALSPDWRLAVHSVADEVERAITGVKGIAATRILYVSQGRVWQVDSDGANPTPLTANVSAMSPAWNSRATHIAYTSLTDAGARVVLREIGGATRTLNATPGGMSSSPAFAPDGSTLVYTHGKENGTDLYAVNAFSSEPARRVTVGRGSDNTSPTFSPDGRRIAFTTNRPGRPDVYISDADGTNAEPLMPFNYGDQSYRTDPDWSPDGRLIAFQSQIAGNFQIMTVSPRDRGVKMLTSTGVNENPSWAPDSRHLVFTSTRGGTRQLWIVDTESGAFRQLTHAAGGARHGAWSPHLQLR